MYKIKGASQATDEYIEVSFRQPKLWPGQHNGMFLSVLLIGDDTTGPGLALTATPPGAESPTGKAHGHASDNFRISLLGSFLMGKEEYGPGAFRFQDGWRTYPSDSNACGPDGGWELTMMADRRGTRRREIQGWVDGSAEAEAEFALQRYFAETFEFDGDLVDLDTTIAPGPSALMTTAGPTSNSGKLNGSFADAESAFWGMPFRVPWLRLRRQVRTKSQHRPAPSTLSSCASWSQAAAASTVASTRQGTSGCSYRVGHVDRYQLVPMGSRSCSSSAIADL
jgi:hypothetical protein